MINLSLKPARADQYGEINIAVRSTSDPLGIRYREAREDWSNNSWCVSASDCHVWDNLPRTIISPPPPPCLPPSIWQTVNTCSDPCWILTEQSRGRLYYTILYSHQIADIVDSRHTIISLALLQQVDLYTSDIFNIFNKTDMVAGVVACLNENVQSHS